MRSLRKTTLWTIVLFALLAACHNDDNVISNENSEFSAGKLATVLVSEDYEVNFWELSPGNIAVDAYRSIEADMRHKGLAHKLTGNNYVDMYKMLAGKNANMEMIQNLEAAEGRYKIALRKGTAPVPPKDFYLASSFDEKVSAVAGRTAASCQNGNGAKYYLDNGYCDGPWGCELNVPPLPFTYGVSTNDHQTFSIHILNGQKSDSGNKIRVSHPGMAMQTINPWTIRTVTLQFNSGGALSYYFLRGLDCATTQYSFELREL